MSHKYVSSMCLHLRTVLRSADPHYFFASPGEKMYACGPCSRAKILRWFKNWIKIWIFFLFGWIFKLLCMETGQIINCLKSCYFFYKSMPNIYALCTVCRLRNPCLRTNLPQNRQATPLKRCQLSTRNMD
jgi:hypothetical protein